MTSSIDELGGFRNSNGKTTSWRDNLPLDGVDGDNTPSGEADVSEQEPRLGTDDGTHSTADSEGEKPLKIDDLLARFEAATRSSLKKTSLESYTWIFRRFADSVGLSGYTKRQIAGKKGKELLIMYLSTVPPASRRYQASGLKLVWMLGLDCPWPLERRDLGRLPAARPKQTPPDAVIQSWAEALAHEKDQHALLIWTLTAQFGLRPSHICRMRWRHLQYDALGEPFAIVAHGGEADFKTSATVAARLPPEVVHLLKDWKSTWKASTGTDPPEGAPIVPWRSLKGSIAWDRELPPETLRRHWARLAKKWSLPRLNPSDCRHWVSTTCRRMGLSRVASAYVLGHDSSSGVSMRDWYDNPGLEDVFTEQAERMPHGCLGILQAPGVELTDAIPKEAVPLIVDYLAGTIGTMEFASAMEKVRLKVISGSLDSPKQSFLKP